MYNLIKECLFQNVMNQNQRGILQRIFDLFQFWIYLKLKL